MYRRKQVYRILPAIFVLFAAACGGDSVGPTPQPPTITISGIEEGKDYPGAVTITISADRGSYQATLNGEQFNTGQTVSLPGTYVLVVQARNGSATSSKTVHFTIGGGVAGVTIIRLINLGANDSGGGGDAIVITDSTNAGIHNALIDAGPAGVSGADAAYVARRLGELGIDSLDFIMLTHAHGDHYLGLSSVIQRGHIRRFIYNGQARSLSSYQSVLTAARTLVGSANMVVPSTLTYDTLGDAGAAVVTIIPPLPTYISQDTDDGTMLNEGSLGMQLKRGTFEMFFTGDGEVEATNRWRTTYASLSQNVAALKVGHHGANNAIFDNGFSGTSSWLTHTAPEIAVISANGTTHPRINALNALLTRSNLRTYCTNVHGEIVIRVAGAGSYAVSVEKNASAVCVAGSQATT